MTENHETRRARRALENLQTTMMAAQLSVPSILARAERMFGGRELMSRQGPGSWTRTTYAGVARDARRLGAALRRSGVRKGDRVATLMWNHATHLAGYFGVPAIGAVLHPLNPRLAAEELAYIIADAGDVALLVDESLLDLWNEVARHVQVPIVFVHGDGAAARASGYPLLHSLLAARDSGEVVLTAPLDENEAVSVCYTSGTTGKPRGVVYSHRSLVLQTLTLASPDALGITGRDSLLLLAPMFHVNAWTIPFLAPMFGARLVLPGPRISSTEILDTLSFEAISAAFGVPTIWTDMLDAFEREPGRWQLPPGLRVYSGGAPVTPSLFRRLHRLGARCQTGWGMTEVSSMASQAWLRSDLQVTGAEGELQYAASNGIALPLFEFRHVDDQGLAAPWDGRVVGELQVRGPMVTANYVGQETDAALTADRWFSTGDVVTIDQLGYVRLVDRLKDLVKSGGEWISTVDMEECLYEHEAVAEAAVIAVSDERWGERPLPIVSCRSGHSVDADEIQRHLATRFPKWMLPERIIFVDELPRTTVGKVNKVKLRLEFGQPPR